MTSRQQRLRSLFTLALMAAGLLLAIVALAGCTMSPAARYGVARQTLSTTQDTLGILHDAGAISDRTLVEDIDPAVQVARVSLDRARSRLPDAPGVDDYLDLAEAAVLRLTAVRDTYTENGP